MLMKTRAITLRSTKYGERKLIVDTYTEECGRMSFIVTTGAADRGGTRKCLSQTLALLDMECDVRPSARLQKVRSARMLYPMTTIPFDYAKLSMAFFIAEVLGYALKDEQEDKALFEYIADSVQWLDSSAADYANFHIVFLLRLTLFLGFRPNLTDYAPGDYFDLRSGTFCHRHPLHDDVLQPGEAARMSTVMRMDYSTMRLFKMSHEERNRLTDTIVSFYRIHVPDFPSPRSLPVLRELFA